MTVRTALVVGAGIAGSTLAWWLGRAGIDTIVVDHAAGPRSGGNPVDLRGLAVPVAERMGVLDALRAAATQTTRLTAVDGRGREIGWIPVQTGTDEFEIGRSDLAAILQAAARPYAQFRHGDTVTAMHNCGPSSGKNSGRKDGRRGDGLEVSFLHSPQGRFDLVIGADGLHSQIRRLVFGPEQHFVTPLGMYVATSMLDGPATDPRTVVLHNVAGRAVAVHPGTGRPGAAFIFRAGPQTSTPDPRHLLATTYAGMEWRVPELLDHACRDEHLWFDTVSRVQVPRWSRGAVVLVGDAAGCVSLFGEGSSMAIVGAATLAQALATHPDNLSTALARYECSHRARLRHHHRAAPLAAHLLVPATRAGAALRNTAFRTWPMIARTLAATR